MANITMSTDLWADASTEIEAVSSEATGFEAEAVLAGPTNLTWRSTGTSAQYVAGDLGQTRDIDFLSILGHNLRDITSDLTVRVRIGNDNTFVTNLYDNSQDEDDLIGPDTDDTPFPTVLNWWLGATVTARYWRVDIAQATNPDGYHEVGRILVGLKFRPEVNFDYGYKLSIKDVSRVSRTHSNIMRVDPKPKTRNVTAVLSHISLAEEVVFNKLSVGTECFMSAYAEAGTGYEELEQQHTVLGLLSQDIGPVRGHAKDRTYQVSVIEGSVLGLGGTNYTGQGGAANQIWLKVNNNLSDVADIDTSQDNLELEKAYPRDNLLDNGDMSVWQRGTTASGLTATGSNSQLADRWSISFTQLTSETYSQDRVGPTEINDRGIGAVYGLRISTSGATDKLGIAQETVMEDWADLISGEEITLSFYASANTETILDDIRLLLKFNSDPNEEYDFADCTVPSGNVVTYFERTVTVGDTVSQVRGAVPSAKLFIRDETAAGAWDAVTFYAIKFEIGRNATRWQHVAKAEQLERCHRHYQEGTITPGRNTLYWYGTATITADYLASTQFSTPMAAVPTAVVTHQAAAGFPAAVGTVSVGTLGIEEIRTCNSTGNNKYFQSSWVVYTGD